MADATIKPNRADQWMVTMSVQNADGRTHTDWGVFDGRNGGEIDSSDTKYRPGNMGSEYSLGGTISIGNITLKRNYQLQRDPALMKGVLGRVGKARVTCGAQPLDADGNSFGDKIVWTGVLKRLQFPDHDSNSGDAGVLEIEISVDGSVSMS